jgi:SSS family solute:Na+ symporter
MKLFKLAKAACILLIVPMAVHGQDVNPLQQTTVDWREYSQLEHTAVSPDKRARPDLTGSFIGIHNDALIVAGGEQYNDIWVATREAGTATWQKPERTLSSKRAFGLSASHPLGLLAIGGWDGRTELSDFTLIRWNRDTETPELIELPQIPGVSKQGSTAVIDDTLFVVPSRTSVGADDVPYTFDLSRIVIDEAGKPVVDAGNARISPKQDSLGHSISPWRKMPSLPLGSGENPVGKTIAAVTQNDGYGDRLYVIIRRHNATELWAYVPDSDTDSAAWERKADIRVDDETVLINTGTAVPLGQSHILILTGPDGDSERKAISYNTITNVWTTYNTAPMLAGDVNTNTVANTAIRWGDDILLVNNGPATADRSGKFWIVDITRPALSFGWQNMTVLVAYLLSMVLVGVYFVFKNSDTNDYFRGGQNIPWWAAACSIYATMLSSLTYVALPALVYRTDWLLYIGTMMILFVAPIAIYIAMPFFRQIDATSAYEYLSKRFNMPVRLFASGLFTLFHIGRMGIVLALTALALSAVTPLDPWQSVLVMGVLSLTYCTLGGVEAVIWTDTIQTFVLLVGAVICFSIIVSGVDGGMSGFIDAGMAGDKFRMVNLDFGPGSITTLSIWVIVLGGLGQNMSSYTADQAVVQRYMTTRDVKAAAKSIWANGILAVPGALLFFGIGTGLFAYYQSQPEKLDPTIQIDQIFPAFIGAELPIGIAGLIVAGIFAAAQSTVSTSMNSIATTVVTDFMRPFNMCGTERGYLNAARVMTLTMGALGTLVGLLFINPEIRSLMEEYFKIIGMFMGALGGLFVLGMTSRRANGRGALLGVFAGVSVMVTVWLMEWANGYIFATIGISTSLVVGYLASLVLPSDKQDLTGLTLFTMDRDQLNDGQNAR